MAKNNVLKQRQEEVDDFEFSDMMDPGYMDGDTVSDMMRNMVEASNHQMRLAFDLTKLIVEKSSAPMNEEAIFSTYKKASKTVAENLALKALWEKLGSS